MIEMKVVRNVILNNIDFYDQPFRMLQPSQESPKFSRLENFKDLTNLTDISDLIIVFCLDKSCQKWYFKQLISQ